MSAVAGAPPWRLRAQARRPDWVPMAAAMALLLGLYVGWQVAGWPAGRHELIGDLFSVPFNLAAALSARRASRRCAGTPPLRTAWRLVALAIAAYLVGDLVFTLYEALGKPTHPSPADVLFVLFYPSMLWGLLRFPVGHQRFRQRVMLALDLAVVAVGGAVVVVCLVLGPAVVHGGSRALTTAMSIATPVGDIVLVVGLGSVLLRRCPPASVRALQFIAAGLFCFVAGDLALGYVYLHGSYQGGSPLDLAWLAAAALFAVGGAAQGRPEQPDEGAVAPAHVGGYWAPYVAVGVAVGLLLLNLGNIPMVPYGTLVIGTLLLAALMAARQFLAQRDLLQTQGQLSYQSLHDALTGLPNRALVLDRAEQMLARSRRSQAPVAALYVDIDAFKHVNDSHGHAAGDELLRVTAQRLVSTVRGADTVGRLGGDEFVVLLDDYALDAGPELVAERICEVLRQPVELHGGEAPALTVTASIGIALGQRECADDLIRDADFALYEAKDAGKNRWVVFESSMQTAIQDRLALELDLGQALEGAEFFLLYQPTIDLQTQTVNGVEALLRWRHPSRGVVAPGDFIPLAEETGLIVPIGRWALRTACLQAAAWRRHGHPIDIAVNVSARQLDRPDLVRDVADALAASGLAPTALTLEVTETALMSDARAGARRLGELKALGVRIAIDDFGTGYSSMAYLRQFPVDVLKIDRSFVAGMTDTHDGKALVHTLVQLGKSLGLKTVGEGIEDTAQLEELQREGCDTGQGFLFARPLAPDDVVELLASGSAKQLAVAG